MLHNIKYPNATLMYQVLSKDTIELEIIPYIPVSKKGPSISVPMAELVNCILYKLKTGVQWEFLPVEALFTKEALHYKTVFGHYRKWCKQGAWKACWTKMEECMYRWFEILYDRSTKELDKVEEKARIARGNYTARASEMGVRLNLGPAIFYLAEDIQRGFGNYG